MDVHIGQCLSIWCFRECDFNFCVIDVPGNRITADTMPSQVVPHDEAFLLIQIIALVLGIVFSQIEALRVLIDVEADLPCIQVVLALVCLFDKGPMISDSALLWVLCKWDESLLD